MDELIAFVRAQWDARCAQLDEDERVAREAAEKAPYDEWDAAGARGEDDAALANWEVVRIARPYNRPDARAVARHIARWDPARVLAEVELERADTEAKRRILDRHSPNLDRPSPLGVLCRYCSPADAQVNWPCPDVLDLVQPYAGKPGWREEWRA